MMNSSMRLRNSGASGAFVVSHGGKGEGERERGRGRGNLQLC